MKYTEFVQRKPKEDMKKKIKTFKATHLRKK